MKYLFPFTLAFFFLLNIASAQVGINSDNSAPDPSAMLDVKSPAKGLLPPRVNLTATNVAGPVNSPAVGLQVYNTSTAGISPYNVTPGIYSWDGTQWIPVIAPKGVNLGDMQYWNGVQWITVPIGVPGQILQILPTGIPAWNGSAYAAITTNAVTNITASSAMSGGTISSDGGSAITAKGICYNTSPNPTTANMKVTGGTGTGSFSSSMSGLLAGTTYYVRAYATNSAGTAYGNEISFTTIANATIPTVTTTAISNITAVSAISGGTVNSAGGATVTARGVCWSTSPNPTTANSKTSNGTGIGGFASTMSSLASNTTYYVRAYATNSAGTGYGNELTFTTLCANTVAVSVVITTSANPVCAGSSVTFSATPTNSGAAPVYQWKVNGANAGTNSATHSYTPSNNDVVTCMLTSNLACVTVNPATSNAITMTVNPLITPLVSIEASTNPVCDGSLVSISATPTNGGIVPVYQWKLNGDNAGTNNSVFSYYPANGDSVYCLITSSHPCASNPAASNGIIITVNPMLAVGVAIAGSANNVCAGTEVTFTSTTTNSGNFSTYQWKNGGIAINGATNATYTYIPNNDDVITCVYTSNPQCTFTNVATSNAITITVNLLPLIPTAATHTPDTTQIIWNWNASVGATGYRWNTTNEYASAIDLGQTTTKTETGLLCNTTYTRFLWSYNSCGNSIPVTLSATSLLCPGIASITTTTVTNINETSAQTGGNILVDTNISISFRGVCYGTSSNPTLLNFYTTNGNGAGSFTSNLMNLTLNTLYYVKAYATYSDGTTYGNELNFYTLPSLSTSDVTEISQTSATGGGIINPGGGAPISSRGVCWNTTQNPTIADNHSNNGNGTGIFVSPITGLTGNTTYFARAFAINNAGTIVYGGQKTFTTSPFPPTVVTNSVSLITTTNAMSGGIVTAANGASVTARGVCWSTTPNPTIAGSKTTDGTGLGNYTSNITGLTANTSYYIRAYATNNAGTSYGNELIFNTLTSPIIPVVTTQITSNISNSSATSGGNILSDGGAPVTFRGVCWSLNPNPTLNDTYSTDGSGIGQYQSQLPNLTTYNQYHVRAYAVNSVGTAYGNEEVFCANLPATVAINASSNPFIFGSNVTFTASFTNAGPGPLFRWRVNGITTGANTSTFIYTPSNGDAVDCILYSDLTCLIPTQSNQISMVGIESPPTANINFNNQNLTPGQIIEVPLTLTGSAVGSLSFLISYDRDVLTYVSAVNTVSGYGVAGVNNNYLYLGQTYLKANLGYSNSLGPPTGASYANQAVFTFTFVFKGGSTNLSFFNVSTATNQSSSQYTYIKANPYTTINLNSTFIPGNAGD